MIVFDLSNLRLEPRTSANLDIQQYSFLDRINPREISPKTGGHWTELLFRNGGFHRGTPGWVWAGAAT